MLLCSELLIEQACAGVCLSKRDILQYLLEGTAASHVEDFGDEESASAQSSTKGSISQGTLPHLYISTDEKLGSFSFKIIAISSRTAA